MLASNMASIFGRHGHKTLLLDLTLRRQVYIEDLTFLITKE